MQKKFYYSLDFYLKPSLIPQFEASFARVIEAHTHHEKGLGKVMQFERTFADEKEVITIRVEMDSLNEMDQWMHTPEIVLEYFGQERGLKILQDYCDATELWVSRIKKPYAPLEHLEPLAEML